MRGGDPLVSFVIVLLIGAVAGITYHRVVTASPARAG